MAVVFAMVSKKYDLPIVERVIAGKSREILEGKTDFARYVFDDSKVDAGKLDIWWASYFSTGDTGYLDKLLKYAGEELLKMIWRKCS